MVRLGLEGVVAPEHRVPGVVAAEIAAAWPGAGKLQIRFPETLRSSLGLLFIDHHRDDMPVLAGLERLPDWTADPATGAISYQCRLPAGVDFGGRLVPAGTDAVDLSFSVKNRTAAPVENLAMQFCLKQGGSEAFTARDHSRTFFLHQGAWLCLARTSRPAPAPGDNPWTLVSLAGVKGPRPGDSHPDAWHVCQESADVPLIATVSADGRHVLGLTWWTGARSLMSNGRIPCLHADPALPPCAPGAEVTVRGRIWVLEGGLDELRARYQAELPR